MHYGQIMRFDSTNGAGVRISLFVSGCTNHCKGCFQPETWNFDFGPEFTKDVEDSIIKDLEAPFYSGLTVLGGEPMELANQEAILPLLRRVKALGKGIWIYTGFLFDADLQKGGKRFGPHTEEILSLTDVIVDGKFVEELKDISLRFRGSSNQRVIDVPASLKAGKVVESVYSHR